MQFLKLLADSAGIQDTSYLTAPLSPGRVYYWRVSATNPGGSSAYALGQFYIALLTGAPDGKPLPSEFALLQNYPNPFNPATTITYLLPENSLVSIRLYNYMGQFLGILLEQVQPAGYQRLRFAAGELPSGIYLYRLQAFSLENGSHRFTQTKKMSLIR